MSRPRRRSLPLGWLVLLTAVLAAWTEMGAGCHAPGPATPAGQSCPVPTVRIVAMSNLAGALEPCGCTEDQLGGVDHLGALVTQLRTEAPVVLLSAGALLFDRPQLDADRATQDRLKAETMAEIMRALGLAAWSPGAPDLADGEAKLLASARRSGAELLAANVTGAPLGRSTVIDAGGIRIGILGVSAMQAPQGQAPTELTVAQGPATVEAGAREVERLRAGGARLLVGLAAMPRGDALRFAEALGSLHVLVIGDPSGQGASNDEPVPPVLVGSTLVVQTANHAQGLAVVDLFVDPSHAAAGPLELQDGGDLERAERLDQLARRIRKLEVRINNCERGGTVDLAALQERKAELAALRAERVQLERAPKAPVAGNVFHYEAHEIREELGADAKVSERLRSFYRRVNDHNRTAFADRKPPPTPEGEPHYVGAAQCKSCHAAAYTFWTTRPHAKAYETLSSQFKEYNLECVGCHVTGYERPGGSTVTHNALLRGVQCEECHGPGSQHLEQPEDPELVILEQPLQFCVDACHHPPHVEDFDPVSKLGIILGPGHGG